MTALALAVFGWALVASGFVAFVFVRLPRVRTASVEGHPVLLVRPTDGLLPAERNAVAAPIDGPVRTVIVSPTDPRIAGATWLRSDPTAPNRKVGHLVAASAALRDEEVFVYADADVIVDAALLAELASAVKQGAAIAVAIPRTVGGKGLGAALLSGVLDQSLLSFRAQAALGGDHAVCGKVVALSKETVARLATVTHVLAEDLALVSAARAEGRPVVTVAAEARVFAAREPSARGVLARMTRWLVALKLQRPFAYAGVPIFIAPTLPLVAMTLVSGAPMAWAALLVLCSLRALLAARLVHARLAPRPGAWLLADALLLTAFARSLFLRRVTWRDRTLTLGRGGRIVDARSAS